MLGLVSRLAPVIVSGNAAVVLASESRPLPAITLSEVIATSDVPGGVVNVITGLRRELVPHLAAHMDVNALDGFGLVPGEVPAVEEAATDNVKRFSRPPNGGLDRYDWLARPPSRPTSSASSSRSRPSGTPSASERYRRDREQPIGRGRAETGGAGCGRPPVA